MTLRLELLLAGRILRLRVGTFWRSPWAARCGGCVAAEAGCVAVSVYWRRAYWRLP